MKRIRVTDEQRRAAEIEIRALKNAGLRPDSLLLAVAQAEPMFTEEIDAPDQEPLPYEMTSLEPGVYGWQGSRSVYVSFKPVDDVDVLVATDVEGVRPPALGQLAKHVQLLLMGLSGESRVPEIDLQKIRSEIEADLDDLMGATSPGVE